MKTLRAEDVTPKMEVAAWSSRYDWETRFGLVQRITPSGQIVVILADGNTARFDKYGNEMSVPGFRSGRYLASAQEVRDNIALKESQNLARNAINKIRQEMQEVREWGPKTMLDYLNELQQKIIAAKVHVVEYQELQKALYPEDKDE